MITPQHSHHHEVSSHLHKASHHIISHPPIREIHEKHQDYSKDLSHSFTLACLSSENIWRQACFEDAVAGSRPNKNDIKKEKKNLLRCLDDRSWYCSINDEKDRDQERVAESMTDYSDIIPFGSYNAVFRVQVVHDSIGEGRALRLDSVIGF